MSRMDPRVALGLAALARGQIAVIQGSPRRKLIEELQKEWLLATVETCEVRRKFFTETVWRQGGSIYELSLTSFWQEDLFGGIQAAVAADANDCHLLIIDNLGMELANPHRREAVRLLISGRVEKIRKERGTESHPYRSSTQWSPGFPPCAILGVQGSLAAFYGRDLAQDVAEVGIFIDLQGERP